MLPKFSIDYICLPKHNKRVFTHLTDDPVEAEDFLMHLLAVGSRIVEIRHEGIPLKGHQADKMLKVAAERVAGLLLRESLDIDGSEVKSRFALAA